MIPLLTLPLLLACGALPEAPADAPPPVPAPPAVDFEDAVFDCCGSERVERVVTEYLDLQGALSQADLDLARAELHTLRGVALAAAADPTLSAHSQGLARQVAGLLEPAADAELPALRMAFAQVSDKLTVLAQANPGGTLRVAVAFCPRVNANWLQAEPSIANPYQDPFEPSSGSFRR